MPTEFYHIRKWKKKLKKVMTLAFLFFPSLSFFCLCGSATPLITCVELVQRTGLTAVLDKHPPIKMGDCSLPTSLNERGNEDELLMMSQRVKGRNASIIFLSCSLFQFPAYNPANITVDQNLYFYLSCIMFCVKN